MSPAPDPNPGAQGYEPLLRAAGLRTPLSGGRTLQADFCLAAGEVLQVSGPSGCGKSTLLRIICRLSAPEAGELRLGGEPAEAVPPHRWRRQVHYLAQKPALLPGSAGQNALAGFETRHAPSPPADLRPRAEALLRKLRLDPAVIWDQDARTLSGGEAARLCLCRGLLLEPAVLLADEPTAALDQESAAALAAVVRRFVAEGGALVLVAHDPDPWRDLSRRVLSLGTGAISAPCGAGEEG